MTSRSKPITPSHDVNDDIETPITRRARKSITPSHHVNEREKRNERGSGTVLMMSVILIAAMVAFVCACLLAWFGCVHKARAAADLAALAGADAHASGGNACEAAKLTAARNQAELTACKVDSNGVQFIVRVAVQVDAKPQIFIGPQRFGHKSEAGNV